ncbi:CIA30 family protein [Undibacterium sp. JH2W]|uniref:CIA30 family protein n=1 Tax=Undibacterium sp. JH2W TaxID=3413037 RepID=UPI003BF16D5E
MQKNILALALALCVGSIQFPASAAGFLVEHVRVFDGQKIQPDRNVLIVDGKIKDDNFKGKPAADISIIDGAGRTLLPGLIDAHVHAYQYQDLPLVYGVTTQIDMFTNVDQMKEINEKMRKGENRDRADLISAGVLATAPGGHGTEFGLAIPTLSKPEEAQAWVDARIVEGSHFIKIVIEHGSEKRPFNSLDNATVKALVKAAHVRHKLAVVHIGTLQEAQDALAAGADGLVHLFEGKQISDAEVADLINTAKRNHAFIIPTFSVLESIAGMKEEDVLADKRMTVYLNKTQIQTLHAPYGKQAHPDWLSVPKKLTVAMQAAGIPILAGTDAGNSGTQYGISLHHELAAMVDAGLSPAEVLASATSVPAKAFNLKDRGHIAKGYKADLVLVTGEPDKNITDTRNIVEVWKDGERVTAQREQKQQEIALQNSQKTEALELPANGRIGLFNKSKLASPFGADWGASTDAFMGGKSSMTIKLAETETANEQAVLNIEAEVRPGFAYPWAGLSVFTGKTPMEASDLSKFNTLKFRVRGDGNQYAVGISVKGSYIPIAVPFKATEEWREVSLPFSKFQGLDPAAITVIAFNAGPQAGSYRFQIADIRLLKE